MTRRWLQSWFAPDRTGRVFRRWTSGLGRELPQFGVSAGAQAMRRFWSMLAHGHGQVWNASEIGRSMGLSDTTVRNYLDKMVDAYVMRGARRIGVEVKRTTAPALTPSMRSAMTDLKLSQLYVVHAGKVTFPVAKKVRAVAFADLLREVGL